MLPVLQVGPLAIQTPGLIWLVGLWVGLQLAEQRSANAGVQSLHIDQMVLWSLIAGIIGARIGFLLRFPTIWIDQPLAVFSLSPAMLDLSGGLLAAGLTAIFYGQRKDIHFWNAMDALTPLFAVLAVAFQAAQLASGTGFGAPTQLPWGIELWGAVRHPSQVYALVLAFAFLLLAFRLSQYPAFGNGVVFSAWLGLTALARLFLEAFRGDSRVWFGNLREAQLLAFIVLATSLWLIRWRSQATFPDGIDNPSLSRLKT